MNRALVAMPLLTVLLTGCCLRPVQCGGCGAGPYDCVDTDPLGYPMPAAVDCGDSCGECGGVLPSLPGQPIRRSARFVAHKARNIVGAAVSGVAHGACPSCAAPAPSCCCPEPAPCSCAAPAAPACVAPACVAPAAPACAAPCRCAASGACCDQSPVGAYAPEPTVSHPVYEGPVQTSPLTPYPEPGTDAFEPGQSPDASQPAGTVPRPEDMNDADPMSEGMSSRAWRASRFAATTHHRQNAAQTWHQPRQFQQPRRRQRPVRQVRYERPTTPPAQQSAEDDLPVFYLD